jgi:23S rRNA (uracil1939-C5)-methyltransferase
LRMAILNTKTTNNYDVKIEKIVANGYGLAFAEGLTIFVSLAVVGDVVRVRITKKSGKVAFAEIVEIIEPSAFRVEPKCKYFGRCGGCDFQQMSDEAQLAAKLSILQDCLKRIGKINFPHEIPIHASPKTFAYRTRTRLTADTRTNKLGFFRRSSNEVFDVDECLVLSEKLQKSLTDLRETLNYDELWASNVEIEMANGDTETSTFSDEILSETKEISSKFGEFNYWFNAKTFFQGNPNLIEKMIETAIGDAKGETAVELFCGVGLFSLPLAKRFEKVFAVESNETSIEFAKKNAELARIENIEFTAQDAGEFFDEFPPQNVEFVLVDPPRTGVERTTLDEIINQKPNQISYVSCDPATLARDLKILTENGYEIEKIDAFDLFPQTHHIETIAILRKSA